MARPSASGTRPRARTNRSDPDRTAVQARCGLTLRSGNRPTLVTVTITRTARVPAVARLVAATLAAGVVLAGMLAPATVGLGALVGGVEVDTAPVDTSTGIAAGRMPLVTTVLDRDGGVLATLYDQYRLPVAYAGIAPAMTAAITAIEDRRFFTESGVDPQSLLRAALHDASGGSVQG